MEKSEFSEKTFEIFINHCLMEKGYQLYIPSQVKEARLAYDALINNLKNVKGKIVPFALQYKIVSKYQVSRPIHKFKFDLHYSIDKWTHKKKYIQHNILCSRNSSLNHLAGYIVPSFITNTELYTNLKNDSLLYNSYFIKPQHQILDDKYHYYTFDERFAYQHSLQQLEDEIQSFGELLMQIESNNNDYSMPIEEFTRTLEYYNTDCKEESLKSIYPAIAYSINKSN